jgi:hypothetical protein
MRYQLNKLTRWLALLAGLSLQSLYAQELPVSSGGEATGTGGSLSYSVGQVVYSTYTGSNGSVAQGVQQPYEISTTGINNPTGISLEMVVYPNPTTSGVYLKVNEPLLAPVDFVVYDAQGKQLLYETTVQAITPVPMEHLAPAIYFLHVIYQGQTLTTFKIIKNHLY